MTTIIQPGEHPFITHESWIRYQNILVENRELIKKVIITHHGKVSSQLLERIQAGIELSIFTEKRYKSLFRQWYMDNIFRKIDNS